MSETKGWRKICTDCQEGEPPKDCEYYGEPNGCNSPTYGKHPTCKESLGVGNAAKMREALKYLRDTSREFCHLILNSKYNEVFDKYKYPEVAKIRDAIANANAALSASPRNCDVGTPQEQIKRWEEFCQEHHERWKPGKSLTAIQRCNCPCYEGNGCNYFIWAQMPYEEVKE